MYLTINFVYKISLKIHTFRFNHISKSSMSDLYRNVLNLQALHFAVNITSRDWKALCLKINTNLKNTCFFVATKLFLI